MEREGGGFSIKGLFSAVGITLLLRSIFLGAAAGFLFLLLAFYTYGAGPGDPAEGWGWLGKILAGGAIFFFYPVLGALGGFVLPMAGGISRRVEGMESWVQGWVNPAMAEVLRRLALSGEGIPLERFPPLLNEKIQRMEEEIASGGGGAGTGARKNALRIFRWLVAEDMVERLRATGESHVTSITVERYARSRVVGWGREWVEEQVDLVRYAIYALWGVLVAIPVYMKLF